MIHFNSGLHSKIAALLLPKRLDHCSCCMHSFIHQTCGPLRLLYALIHSPNVWTIVAVVCTLQPPSLLIRKVWVLVMHFCLCPIHCRLQCIGERAAGRIIQIDFSAAFDTVNHLGILYKLCSVGIGGSVLSRVSDPMFNPFSAIVQPPEIFWFIQIWPTLY